jgi:DNA-binding XRE family transcriptional regulator
VSPHHFINAKLGCQSDLTLTFPLNCKNCSKDLADVNKFVNFAAKAFCIAESLKEERLRAGLTQEQLAERVGTKKAYISRIENGKADIQLSTLFRLFAGLGKRVNVAIV